MDSSSFTIAAAGCRLDASLQRPAAPRGLVLFVHGSGSNRLSPRNQAVARDLGQAGLATLLLDLHSAAERRRGMAEPWPDASLARSAERVLAVLAWLADQPSLRAMWPVGLFGSSSGAAVALLAAAARPQAVAAVVSRGGRPDLAAAVLERVAAPTLLIVGGADVAVLQLNREAALRLNCPHQLVEVPGAGHLFEQPGSLESVARLACDWFLRFLPSAAPQPQPLRRGTLR
jgi:dienelactone hydrolase